MMTVVDFWVRECNVSNVAVLILFVGINTDIWYAPGCEEHIE
jgi:hypothetical protein